MSGLTVSGARLERLCRFAGVPPTAGADAITAAVVEAVDESRQGTGEIPAGHSVVSTTELDELRSAEAARRDEVVDQAVRDHRITNSRRGHWRRAMDTDPAGTEQLLGRLASGVRSTAGSSTAGSPTASRPGPAVDDLVDGVHPRTALTEAMATPAYQNWGTHGGATDNAPREAERR